VITRTLFSVMILFTSLPVFSQTSENVNLLGSLLGGRCTAVAIDRVTAYVGINRDLKVIDCTFPDAPLLLGSLSSNYDIQSITLTDNRAYIACGFSGFRIIDIRDPTKPTELGSFGFDGRAEEVVLNGDLAYVAVSSNTYSSDRGLHIIDVSQELLSRVVFDLLGRGILHPVHEHDSVDYFSQQLVPAELAPALLCTTT